jgi:hypothetical protein
MWGEQVYMDFYRVTEAEVIRGVYDYFHFRGGYCWRNNTGSVVIPGSETSRRRFVQFSEAGAADILGVHTGYFFALETKTEKGKQSKEQVAWMDVIREHGGIYLLLRPSTYIDQIDEALRGLGLLAVE